LELRSFALAVEPVQFAVLECFDRVALVRCAAVSRGWRRAVTLVLRERGGG